MVRKGRECHQLSCTIHSPLICSWLTFGTGSGSTALRTPQTAFMSCAECVCRMEKLSQLTHYKRKFVFTDSRVIRYARRCVPLWHIRPPERRQPTALFDSRHREIAFGSVIFKATDLASCTIGGTAIKIERDDMNKKKLCSVHQLEPSAIRIACINLLPTIIKSRRWRQEEKQKAASLHSSHLTEARPRLD